MPPPDSASPHREEKEETIDQQTPPELRRAQADARKSEPEKFDLHVSSDNIPRLLIAYLERIAKPQPSSRVRVFVKDYLPVLTPVAALAISVAVSYATILFSHRAAVAASSETLGKLVAKFGKRSGGEASKESEKKSDQSTDEDPTAVAMEIALYGNQAIPAVTVALSAEDPSLRRGGVLVAEQMYRGGTVPHKELTNTMLKYYESSALRRGVVEWLDEMGLGLFDEDSALALQKLDSTFGTDGHLCGTQDPEVARNTAEFLFIHAKDDSNDLALGLLENCPDQSEFESAREQAAIAIPEIAKHLPKEKRDSVLKSLQGMIATASPGLAGILSNSITEIQKIP